MDFSITLETVKDSIGIAGFAISLFLLFIHLKNRRTQLRSYWITRDAYRSSSIQLVFVHSEQLEGFVFVKLVLFNPGSIATVIKSFSVEKKVKLSLFQRILKFREWERIEGSKWWPTENPETKTVRYLADEYRNLFVEDQRDICVVIPGMLDREKYRFEIRTNNGGFAVQTTIDATRTSFAHASRDWFYEK